MTQTLSDGATHQPVGPTVDARPARRPQDVRLEGRFGAVEKLAARHAAGLWDATQGHDQIWTYMSAYGPFDSWSSFSDWVATRTQLEDPFSYAVLDRNGAAIGVATLMEIRPAMRVIEMGHIVYAPNLQRTPLATEAQFLLACYVFEVLGYRRYEWKCNALNAPSRRAAERLGRSRASSGSTWWRRAATATRRTTPCSTVNGPRASALSRAGLHPPISTPMAIRERG